jgi:DNA mismatch endonuclease (patch repair protein)
MSRIRSANTSPELAVRQIVHRLGYRYRLHVKALPGTPDIVLTRLRAVIDVRGCFWHSHRCKVGHVPASRKEYWLPKLKRNTARDRKSARALRALGWNVLIVWECETRDAERLEVTLRKFLSARQ